MVRLTEDGVAADCCNCRHFRMNRPAPEYCTTRKERVHPLNESHPEKYYSTNIVVKECPDFKLRKGLKLFNQITYPNIFKKLGKYK